jgi:hypothetical protein
MTDKELLAEAERRQFAITPVAGDAIDRLVAEGYGRNKSGHDGRMGRR